MAQPGSAGKASRTDRLWGRAEDPEVWMRLALRLARNGLGCTSPNPAVGAVLVKSGELIGEGWHRKAGLPHAEVEAINSALERGNSVRGATLYVTLEPCSTCGRTPPCTEAIVRAGIREVVVGAVDPNPKHRGRGLRWLSRAGLHVTEGVLARECAALNAGFNHWIVHGTPLVTVKAAMTLDGKIATAAGESKWITGERARGYGMRLRLEADAVLVGIRTILADDPQLNYRGRQRHVLRRVLLDSMARTPLRARVVSGPDADLTTVVVSRAAPARRIKKLAERVRVIVAPVDRRKGGGIDLRWLLRRLGKEQVTSLLVEGGGEVNASFLMNGLAQRAVFAYAPMILGGRDARRAVAGEGATRQEATLQLARVQWRKAGGDLMMTADVLPARAK